MVMRTGPDRRSWRANINTRDISRWLINSGTKTNEIEYKYLFYTILSPNHINNFTVKSKKITLLKIYFQLRSWYFTFEYDFLFLNTNFWLFWFIASIYNHLFQFVLHFVPDLQLRDISIQKLSKYKIKNKQTFFYFYNIYF